jgi:hypothetical protein
MKDKKYIVYKIINKLNNMIYIGCHVTTNVNDKYMGSGTNIKKAITQYGLENFDKYILYQFDNEPEMLDKEAELVNIEFISEKTNYNIIVGGRQFLTLDTIPVKDKNGNFFRVHKSDERYLSGELVHNKKGMINVTDKNGNRFSINKRDEIEMSKYLSGELISITKNKTTTKDIFGNTYHVDINDPRYLSGDIVGITKGFITTIDKFGNYHWVNINDERYLSGELNHLWTNKKHTDETKRKIGDANSIKQKGVDNSQYGTCWITNGIENKKIKKTDLIPDGWKLGRKINRLIA